MGWRRRRAWNWWWCDDARRWYGPSDGRRAGHGFNPNHFAWGREHFPDRFHHRFRNRLFAFGFGAPYLYDYAYNSCWTQIPTRYGWHWVYVCGYGAY
ncbi:MAG: hypothetical protein WCD69_28090 [Xanthobacteraceae bacterium]